MKKQCLCALGAAVVLGFCGAASAGGHVRISYDVDSSHSIVDSPDLALTTGGTAVSYAYKAHVDTDYSPEGYVADVDLQGFLFCNHVDPTPQSTVYLIARYGAWNYGYSAAGTVAAVPGVTSVSYNGQTLNLSTDPSTQCFQADAHGQGITDLHHVYASGFDFGAVDANTSNTSAVTIAIKYIPPLSTRDETDDKFLYTVTVQIADPQAMGQMHTQSDPGTDYFLREGYDASVFSSCNIVDNGSTQRPGVVEWTRSCQVRANKDVSQLDGTVPVVAAALFTGPDASEKDLSDNLAFGYPAVTPH